MATRSRSRRRPPQPWWSTWPGALATGLASFVMVNMGAVPAALFAVLFAEESAGTDVTVLGPGATARILSAVLALVFLVPPVFAVVMARRKWLGWLVVALAVSFVIMCWGLVQLGLL